MHTNFSDFFYLLLLHLWPFNHSLVLRCEGWRLEGLWDSWDPRQMIELSYSNPEWCLRVLYTLRLVLRLIALPVEESQMAHFLLEWRWDSYGYLGLCSCHLPLNSLVGGAGKGNMKIGLDHLAYNNNSNPNPSQVPKYSHGRFCGDAGKPDWRTSQVLPHFQTYQAF